MSVATLVDIPESPLRRADRIALKARLGLALAPEEAAFVGKLRLRTTFKREEVIEFLGFVDPKAKMDPIPRMLPVDVALGRLGMPIIRALPNGAAERLKHPKAWAARERADRAIALYVAKTYTKVPEGWYPDRERLMMPDVVDDASRAAGVPDLGPGARVLLEDAVTFLRYDLLQPELRLAGYQMWHRRRLAGMEPMVGDGLVFGYWDDVLTPFDVPAHCFRGAGVAWLATDAMVLRDCAVACFFDADPGAPDKVAYDSGPYRTVYRAFAAQSFYASRVGPGEPIRSYGGGLARRYRIEAARPGATWSSRPVRERPEAFCNLGSLALVYLDEPLADEEPETCPEGFVAGADLDPPWTAWMDRFVSA